MYKTVFVVQLLLGWLMVIIVSSVMWINENVTEDSCGDALHANSTTALVSYLCADDKRETLLQQLAGASFVVSVLLTLLYLSGD